MRGKELKKSGFGEQGIGENGRLRRVWRPTIKGNVTIEALYLSRKSLGEFGSDWRGRG